MFGFTGRLGWQSDKLIAKKQFVDNNNNTIIDMVCVVAWCGVVLCGVVWCGVVWCGVVWVVWCGVLGAPGASCALLPPPGLLGHTLLFAFLLGSILFDLLGPPWASWGLLGPPGGSWRLLGPPGVLGPPMASWCLLRGSWGCGHGRPTKSWENK